LADFITNTDTDPLNLAINRQRRQVIAATPESPDVGLGSE
jgi:hypothetical protein